MINPVSTFLNGVADDELLAFLKECGLRDRIAFESVEFEVIFNKIIIDIGKEGGIDSEHLLYFSEKFFISSEELSDIFSSFPKEMWTEDQDCSFEKRYLEYRGFRFNEMIGQGVALWIEKV